MNDDEKSPLMTLPYLLCMNGCTRVDRIEIRAFFLCRPKFTSSSGRLWTKIKMPDTHADNDFGVASLVNSFFFWEGVEDSFFCVLILNSNNYPLLPFFC
jgi:hypothetical protein